VSETPVSIKFHSAVYLTVALGIVGTLSYAYASPTIRGHVLIEHMPVGGLTRAQAQQKVQSWAASRLENGTRLTIDGEPYQIQSADIDLDYDIDGAIAAAWNTGRRLNPVESLAELAMLALVPMDISIPARLNIQKLQYEVDTIATSVDEPGLDVRLKIEGSDVTVLSDTKPGFFAANLMPIPSLGWIWIVMWLGMGFSQKFSKSLWPFSLNWIMLEPRILLTVAAGVAPPPCLYPFSNIRSVISV